MYTPQGRGFSDYILWHSAPPVFHSTVGALPLRLKFGHAPTVQCAMGGSKSALFCIMQGLKPEVKSFFLLMNQVAFPCILLVLCGHGVLQFRRRLRRLDRTLSRIDTSDAEIRNQVEK
jgi:hypothetical protein